MQVVLDMVLLTCGLVMLLASQAVLTASARAELSMRALSAICVGGGGIVTIRHALGPAPVEWFEVVLPLGVTLWVLHAAWLHRGVSICSATDWGALADQPMGERNHTQC